MECNEHTIFNIQPPNGNGISDVQSFLNSLGKKYGIRETLLVKRDDLCVAEWVRLKCEYSCGEHGKNWCCPPETPGIEQVKAILKDYEKAVLLFTGKERNLTTNKEQRRHKRIRIWKGIVALERRLFSEGYRKAFGLVSCKCSLCKRCSYPGNCMFPKYKRPSVKSFSIDISQTLRNIGPQLDIQKHDNQDYACSGIILLD